LRERKASLLDVSVDDAVVVEVVDGVENRANNDDGIVLSNFALCKDTVKELSAGEASSKKR